jgi:hypothetical protein
MTALSRILTLSLEDSERLERMARDIDSLRRSTILQTGKILAEAREVFRYSREDGGFTGWVETRLSMSVSTAYAIINAYENIGEEMAQSFTALAHSTILALGAPGVTDEVREQVKRRADGGERVSINEVHRLTDEAKSAKDALDVSEKERRRLLRQVSELSGKIQAASEYPTSIIVGEIDYEPWKQALVAIWRQAPMAVREWFWGEFKTAFSAPDSSSCVASNPLEPGALHDATDGEGHADNAGGNGAGRHAVGEEDRPEHPEIHHELGDMAAEAPATNGGAGNGGVEDDPEIPLGLIRDPALRESERERRAAG